MANFKKGDNVFIVYRYQVVKAKIVAIHKEFEEIELNYLEGMGIIRDPLACFKTQEEAEKYLQEVKKW